MRRTLRLLLTVALAAAAGLLAAGLVDRFGLLPELPALDGTATAAALLLLALALPLVLAVHELGHVLAGRLVRFEFQALIVGPLRVRSRDGRLHFGLNRSLALAGGIAVLLPRSQDRLRERMAAMTAGGPTASILLAAAALGAAALARPRMGADGGLLLFVLGAAALMSAAVALVTLVPGTTSGFSTDGRRLYLLLRGGPEAEREVALLALIAASQAGVRPRDLDAHLIRRLVEPEAGEGHRVTGWMLAYDRHLDRGEIDAAGEALDAARALRDALPATAAPALTMEAAYFTALHRGDATAARALLDGAGTGALVPPETPLRARAAVLLAEGRPAEAMTAIRAAREVLDQDLDRAAEETARRQLEDLEARARERAAAG